MLMLSVVVAGPIKSPHALIATPPPDRGRENVNQPGLDLNDNLIASETSTGYSRLPSQL